MDEKLSAMLSECMKELEAAHESRYPPEKADRTAALFLSTQLRLTDYAVDLDFKAKMAKNEVERVEAEKYFDFKGEAAKLTEAALKHATSKDESVNEVKAKLARAESEQKKITNVMNIMNNGHIFFRTISKNI